MKPTILVVSSVHPPDDPRIRHKLVETLIDGATVRFAVRAPGPSQAEGMTVELLAGGRVKRTLAASWKIVRGGYDVASAHDPELLPAMLVAGALRRRVVFDVHEDIPAQMRSRSHYPRMVRIAASWLLARLLRLMERVGRITLAEPNYAHLFRSDHPVFPNYLSDLLLPELETHERTGAVYLGDITEARGIGTAIEAIGMTDARPDLTLIGRCLPDVRKRLEAHADDAAIAVRFLGFLPLDEALPIVAEHSVALSPLHDLPNYHDSLPTKLLEYLSLGVPVVASALPGAQRVLGDATAGRVG